MAALASNETYVSAATAIDNWEERKYPQAEVEFRANVSHHLADYTDRLTILKANCLTIDPLSIRRPVTVFYYDGDHENTEEGTARFFTCLADSAIIMLDDWNRRNIQADWRRAVKQGKISIIKEWVLDSPGRFQSNGWWEGFYIAAIERKTE